jgi:hypothetical protein
MGGIFSISDNSSVKKIEKVEKSLKNGVGKIIKSTVSKELGNSLKPKVRKNNSLGKFKNTSNLEISKPLKKLNNNHSVNLSFENNSSNTSKKINNKENFNLTNSKNNKIQTQINSSNRKNNFNFLRQNLGSTEPQINSSNRKNNFLRQNLGSTEPKINRISNNFTPKIKNNKINELPRFSQNI